MSRKKSAGIEPGTFQFVGQHLNHCATAVPKIQCKLPNYKLKCLHRNNSKSLSDNFSRGSSISGLGVSEVR